MMRMITRPLFGTAVVLAAVLGVAGLDTAARASEKSDSKVKLDVKADKPGADGTQVVTVKLDIEEDWHLYANPVNNELLETGATKVKFLAGEKALEAKVEYPKGKRVTEAGEAYDIYEGRVTIKATVQRPKDGPVKLQIKVQACSDKTKKCLLPATVSVEVP